MQYHAIMTEIVRSTLANHFHYYHNINLRYYIMLLILYFTQYSHKRERVVQKGRALICRSIPVIHFSLAKVAYIFWAALGSGERFLLLAAAAFVNLDSFLLARIINFARRATIKTALSHILLTKYLISN